MAHHLAELLGSAQGNKKNLDQANAEKIESTIIKLWASRASFENRINPLSELKPVIEVLHTLDPSKNKWILHDDGFRSIYDVFRRLMLFLILWKSDMSDPQSKIAAAKRTTKFQSSDEVQIVSAINLWLGEEKVAKVSFKRPSGKRGNSGDVELLDLGGRLIVEAQGVLEQLKKSIVEKVENKDKAMSPSKSKRPSKSN